MITKRKVKGKNQVKVTFAIPQENCTGKVSLVGDFNNWDPDTNVLVRRANKTYSTSLTLTVGQRYSFRYFLDDGNWINDEAADAFEPNPFGSKNSILLT